MEKGYTGIAFGVPPPPDKMIEVFVNGKPVQVSNRANLVEACRIAGYYVPSLCYHPRLQPIGKCGLCCVQVEGSAEPVLGCSAHVSPGMRIVTDTIECQNRSALAMSRIVNKTRTRAPENFAHAPELANLMEHSLQRAYDDSSAAIQLDTTKCVECTRCVRMCRDVQGLNIWKYNEGQVVPITTSSGLDIADTLCVSCGQCASVCPSGAIMEKSHLEQVQAALRSGKVVVASVAPSVRVTIGEEFGLPPGAISTGRLVMALKRAGFHFVFDTNFAADLTIMEEGTEFANRLKGGKGPFPMFSTCCPCWITLMEKQYPSLIPHMSTCKSPQGMIGALVKTYFAGKIGKKPQEIFHVSIMPCTAKKDEILRPDEGRSGYRDFDYVMTTRECANFLKRNGITNFELELPFDNPMGIGTGAGAIFGASGGVMEAVLRTAADKVAGEPQAIPNMSMTACRGFDGIKTAEVSVAGHRIVVGIVNGVANIKRFMSDMERIGPEKCGYHFVEIMACPGGCIGGGGQPKSNDPEILKKRAKAIYEVDELLPYRRSHENPQIMELYKTFLGEPNGERAHHLLHTHYRPHKVKQAELAVTPVIQTASEGEAANAVAVLYASVGGNTEGVARSIYNDLRSSRINAKLWPMDACVPQDLVNVQTAIFLTCTFGDGERPPQAAPVWDWLDSQQAGALKGLQYAVFGLGSTKYSHFNQSGKQIDFKLEGLGAQRLIEIGLGDDAAEDGFATALEPWQGQLYEELGVEPPKTALVPHYRVVVCYEASTPIPPPAKTMYATVSESRLATPEDYNRPIRYYDFDLADTGLQYQVGDSLGIHPSNLRENVDRFLRDYRLNPEAVVSVVPVDDAAALPLPPCVTVGHLFQRYMDLFCRPRKLFFRQLAQFATSKEEKARLELLASKEGSEQLASYLKDNPSCADVLSDFKSAHPSLDFLVEMIPLIKPRLYSVASSPKFVGSRCQLIIGIPTEVSRARGTIKGGGLTTSWLPTLHVGDRVPVLVHEGSLRPPTESTAPMLLVGLGTGLAPMRALLQDRLQDKHSGLSVGSVTLYQACRFKDKDFILQEEMKHFLDEGVLSRLIGAFSHQNPKRFETVDLLISEDPKPVWEIVCKPNAHYYYCGPAAFNIPAKLESAIVDACITGGKMPKENALLLIEKMKAEYRWRVEAF
eukprot:TRINITY_DN38_c0_g3_i1.p1 TRINITY_DN38_c0_g3~~TRINITY_DN38_c0_g3_i1.p1  ORF type:complete len:1209 (-),score=302.45 TRINITY_DN38_c0_g3_i1:136-3645(-)